MSGANIEAAAQPHGAAAQLEAAKQQLADLTAQAQARANAGQAPTATDTQVAAAQAAIEAGANPADNLEGAAQ